MGNNNVMGWFHFADTDLALAEHACLMHPRPLEIICYHCQQAAEKYLKGYLVHKGIRPPKTHELDLLCNMCLEFDSRFDEIFDKCEMLSDYGVQPRYPNEMEIFEHHMQKALTCAQQIKAFAPLQELRAELEQE